MSEMAKRVVARFLDATGDYEIQYRIPGKGGWKSKKFKDEKVAKAWVAMQKDSEDTEGGRRTPTKGDVPDMEVKWPSKK
jgi:hypothetical protein